ncbi:MAG: MerR family transcriptional regulator [Rhodobacteraceae bacterium]|nr:MerR family transcriptional regulator [Paracoccaceae bacterium]
MAELFDSKRTYILGDPELDVLGTREKLAQWRHRRVGPPWVKIGRKVAYLGTDLNAYIVAQRTDPNNEAA